MKKQNRAVHSPDGDLFAELAREITRERQLIEAQMSGDEG